MLMNTDLAMGGYRGDAVPAMQRRMIDAMETIPGIQSVALTSTPPLDQAWTTTMIFTDETTDLRPSNAAARPFTFRIISRILPGSGHGPAVRQGRHLA